MLRRDLDAEVLVQIVGRALLNHCEAHFVEPTGGGDRQLKTERKIYEIMIISFISIFHVHSPR